MNHCPDYQPHSIHWDYEYQVLPDKIEHEGRTYRLDRDNKLLFSGPNKDGEGNWWLWWNDRRQWSWLFYNRDMIVVKQNSLFWIYDATYNPDWKPKTDLTQVSIC